MTGDQGGAAAAAAPTLDSAAAFRRYEDIRARLPEAAFPPEAETAANLAAVAERFAGFVFDAFGVLNVGDTPIPGAAERVRDLRAAGKSVAVLTNAASYTKREAEAKYRRLGFDFEAAEIVSSRDVAAQHLAGIAAGAVWAGSAALGDDFSDIPADVGDVLENEALWQRADGFLFLSTARWTPALQARLSAAVMARPRPVVIANPDLVAPREGGLSIEPGFWGHALEDETGQRPHFFGKPYGAAFAALPPAPGPRAMVGDTLHTDILGGRAAGLSAILVADHGLFQGQDLSQPIRQSGIVPDIIVRTT